MDADASSRRCQFTLRSLFGAMLLAGVLLGVVQWLGADFFARVLHVTSSWPGGWLLTPALFAALCAVIAATFNRLLGRLVRGSVATAVLAVLLVGALAGAAYLGWAQYRCMFTFSEIGTSRSCAHPDSVIVSLYYWVDARYTSLPVFFCPCQGQWPRVWLFLQEGSVALSGVAGCCLGLMALPIPRRLRSFVRGFAVRHRQGLRRTPLVALAAVVVAVPWLGWRLERVRWQWEDEANWAKRGATADYRDGTLVGLSFDRVTSTVRSREGPPLEDGDLRQLEPLASLERLGLFGADITDAGLVHLKGLTRLEWLSLRGTRVTGLGVEHLRSLPELDWLDLSETPTDDEGLEHLAAVPNLDCLWLKNTQVTDAGLVHLRHLKNLTRLDLSATKITDAGLEHLECLSKLEMLELNNTQISDTGLRTLRELPSLRLLEMYGTDITEGAAHEFMKTPVTLDSDHLLMLPELFEPGSGEE